MAEDLQEVVNDNGKESVDAQEKKEEKDEK